MYEVRLDPKPSLLYFVNSGKIYALISCQVIANYFEIIPAPVDADISSVANPTNGKNYTVNLRVIGTATDAPTLRQGTFPVEIPALNSGLDKDGVMAAIGNKEYNFTINIMLGGAIQKSGSGTITQNSNIDIE